MAKEEPERTLPSGRILEGKVSSSVSSFLGIDIPWFLLLVGKGS